MSDLASIMLGWCSVPIPASIDVKDIEYILNHAEVTTLVTSRVILNKIMPLLPSLPHIRLIVVMDHLTPEDYTSYTTSLESTHSIQHIQSRCPPSAHPSQACLKSDASSGKPSLMIVDFNDAIAVGTAHPLESPNLPENEDETLMTIVYTSGSTGRPKGAINVYGRWNSFITFLYLMSSPLVRLSFMPLAHNTERQQSHLTTCFGGKMAFSRGEMARIFEEFALVNPTTISAAPRFYDSIYNQYQATLSQFREDYPQISLTQAEQYCYQQYHGILGNAMQVLIVGGAAVSQSTKEFLQKCFQISVFDGYGTTEAGGIAADGKLYPNTQVKVVDCPELGYTSEDKPWPRGEVWAKTNTMVLGYYKDPAQTADAFRDGWFVTGDIVEVRDGHFFIIDRRKNLFKLAQGVFVAPSAIENKLLVSDFVHQIYVYGDHTRSNLVAIVVPNIGNLAKWCAAQGHIDVQAWAQQNLSAEEIAAYSPLGSEAPVTQLVSSKNVAFAQFICSLPVAVAKVHRELVKTANQIDLPTYHIPSSISLEYDVWTPENRLVTPTDKPQRASLEKKYKSEIERMYLEVAEREVATTSIVEKVKSAVEDALAVDGAVGDAEDLAANLATDSLSVLKLIHTLNRQFGTNLSFMDVMKETGGRLTPELIAEVVQRRSEESKGSKPQLDPWSLVHPLVISDMEITVPVDQSLINDFYEVGAAKDQAPFSNILVTGATGFLGFHLVFELLEQYPDARLHLLIRASNSEEAKARLTETVASKQKRTFSAADLARITFIVGDIAQPHLGVDPEVWNSLASEISAIFHVAATVNWMWGYDTMRAPNVLGTVDLLKLATTTKMKFFFYVSTVSTSETYSIAPYEPYTPLLLDWETRGPLEETSLVDRRHVISMSGYSVSKWIAETIVRRSITLGLPGCIMRPGMITGHSQSGACHPTDFSPRLLIGLSQAKVGFTSDLALEWMPVDFCAAAVRALAVYYQKHILSTLIAEQALGVPASFNIQNPALATYTEILSYLRSSGTEFETKEYQDWRQFVTEHPHSPLWPLLPFFGEEKCQMNARIVPSPQTDAILKQSNVLCPPADGALFRTYIRYLQEERLV